MVTAEYFEQKLSDAKTGRENLASLYELAQKAIHWARETSREKGFDSSDSCRAWDTVEELLTVISNRNAVQQNPTYFDSSVSNTQKQ
ncbi:MAG: hypothetical protein BRC33_05060 [Cyanobacteria bacterium SW_9_44_58]|nr:MAG: hypothetical protein BRC33_05060 [Cyanobacteria bacterium SW_9_44_58]